MKKQNTSSTDGTFSGHRWEQVSSPADSSSECHDKQSGGYQSPNDYTQMKSQNTQSGWDGSFVGIKIPSPMQTDGDNGGSQLGNFQSVSFSGFNNPNEASSNVGPVNGPSNGQPTNGSFPGQGTGFDAFNRQSE